VLSLTSAVGCVPPFYAYPSVSYVPGLVFGPDHKQMHVFRLEVSDETPGPGHYLLRELALTPQGRV